MSKETIQNAILGEVLPNIGKRHAGMATDTMARAIQLHLGTRRQRTARAMSFNVQHTPQSVVKRVRNGGTHSAKDLKRQLEYIVRDEATQSTWLNFNGVERNLYKNSVETTVPLWTSGWAGSPKRGHTDHIILSFPKDTDIEAAENIAREWGQTLFGSGDFGDLWRYVAALHANTEHVHAHFIVEKHGIEHGNFLSISMKSELNFDVMRELHSEIAGKHGVALNASSRLSRGIVEYPPRPVDYRIAHEAQSGGGQRSDAKVNVDAPPMSIVARMKREAEVRNYSKQYLGLSTLARLTSPVSTGDEFMEKLSGLFQAAAEKLEQGVSLMTDISGDHHTIDPSARLIETQQQLVTDAKQAWEDIQQMEAGPERVELERQFTESVRETDIADPFFDFHSDTVAPVFDLYHLGVVEELNNFRDRASADTSALQLANEALDEIRSKLGTAFEGIETELEAERTSAAEMAERFMLKERTKAQLTAWGEAGFNAEIGNGIPDEAKGLLEELKEEIRASAEKNGREVDWTKEQEKAESYIREGYIQNKAEFGERYDETCSLAKKQAVNIVDDYELPRDLSEALARDQLMEAEKYTRLADVPAIERIVDRVAESLSEQDLEAVRAGDSTALLEEVKDPAIRAAVASELKNEANISDDYRQFSESVDRFQNFESHKNTRTTAKEVSIDVSDDYSL